MALYTELPYFIEENAGRYTDFKKRYPDYSYEKIITYVNIGLDREFYENVSVVDDADSITVLVNKYKKLPDDFEPELVQVEQSMCAPTVGPQYLRREAYEAFVKMREDAKQLGLNITVCSGYRSIRTQELIWNDALKRGRTLEDVDSSIARAGHSEHHTGLAIDVITAEYDVEKTKEFEWYSQNAYKYGFIIRYPKDKEHITGYKYEPWHLRYVGPEIAKEIYEKDITFDEYYVQVIQPGKSNGTGRGNRCCF
nr:M15 family metallopeptidase [Thermoclostridium stercorarium]